MPLKVPFLVLILRVPYPFSFSGTSRTFNWAFKWTLLASDDVIKYNIGALFKYLHAHINISGANCPGIRVRKYLACSVIFYSGSAWEELSFMERHFWQLPRNEVEYIWPHNRVRAGQMCVIHNERPLNVIMIWRDMYVHWREADASCDVNGINQINRKE